MAASDSNKDYVHLLVTALGSQTGPPSDFTYISAYSFETRFQSIDASAYCAEADSLPIDFIVFEIGANVNRDSAIAYDFQAHYGSLILGLKAKHPGAAFVSVTTFWATAFTDSMIKGAATSTGIWLADIHTLSEDTLNFAYTERQFQYHVVGIHPGDRGMQSIADVIAATIQANDVPAALGEIPTEFRLHQNYPNPFNPGTTIAFDLPHALHARVLVYDVLGREVAELTDEDMDAGSYRVSFNAGGLASGVYFCRLEAGGHAQTIKLAVLK
jgi:hypothetical protein